MTEPTTEELLAQQAKQYEEKINHLCEELRELGANSGKLNELRDACLQSYSERKKSDYIEAKFEARFAEMMAQTKPDGEESNGTYQRRYAAVHDYIAYSMQDEFEEKLGITKPYVTDQLRNAMFFLKQAVTPDSVKPDGTLEIADTYIMDQKTGAISLTPEGKLRMQEAIEQSKQRL